MIKSDVEVQITYSEDMNYITIILRDVNGYPIAKQALVDGLLAYAHYLKDSQESAN